MYSSDEGVDLFARHVRDGSVLEVVELERRGVQGILIKDLSDRLGIARTRFYSIVGVPKATAEKKAAAGGFVKGTGALATLGMVKLLGIAQEIVDDSLAADAEGFDTAHWLGEWIERPQAALGGRKPADFIETPTGLEIVVRLLGSAASGAYQ